VLVGTGGELEMLEETLVGRTVEDVESMGREEGGWACGFCPPSVTVKYTASLKLPRCAIGPRASWWLEAAAIDATR